MCVCSYILFFNMNYVYNDVCVYVLGVYTYIYIHRHILHIQFVFSQITNELIIILLYKNIMN